MNVQTDLSERPRIVRLSNHLINQIAAGEVVERPASVVKELVENALDAKSRRIEVHLKQGGTEEITILDDGVGMGPEDLKLCVERHTTSKVKTESDLESIGTFGFRGEALSSIASVAELEIRSRQASDPNAHFLNIRFGQWQKELRPIGAPVGTSVSVRQLFAQVPARLKFLKTVATELSHVVRTVRETALGNPEVAFSLFHQGSRLHQWANAGREGRFREGFKPAWTPLHFQERHEHFELEAFLSPPHLITDRGDVVLFINARPVKNRTLLAAVRNAYRDCLGPHHEPSGVLYLDIRKDWVDVNVHPQKLEVRLLQQEKIYGWLTATLRKVVSSSHTVREFPQPASPLSAPPPARYAPSERPDVPSHRTFPPTPVPVIRDFEQAPLPFGSPTKEAPSAEWPFRYLGQIKQTYLICEDAEGILFFDQHALHEKLAFERLKKQAATGPVPVQPLLVPCVVRLPNELHPILDAFRPALGRLGFEVDFFGDGDVAVKSRPDLLEETKVEAVLIETLKALRDSDGPEREGLDRALEPVLATLACHSVVRAGQALSEREALSLLGELKKIELGWTCPHGRPVVFRLNFFNLERHFERN